MPPLVFIFDLDATMIGDTVDMNHYDGLLDFVKKSCAIKAIGDAAPCRTPPRRSVAPPELVRPGMRRALADIRKSFPRAAFFVFSSGVASHVKKYVELVERGAGHGVRFSRPLFSRESCVRDENNSTVKMAATVLPAIARALHVSVESLEDRYILVDDRTDDVLWDVPSKRILCSPYEYTPVVEVDEALLRLIHGTPMLRDHVDDVKPPYMPVLGKCDRTFTQLAATYYRFVASRLKHVSRANKLELRDTFMQRFVSAVRRHARGARPFSAPNVARINKDLAGL